MFNIQIFPHYYRSQNLNTTTGVDSVSNVNEIPVLVRMEQPIDRVTSSNQDVVPQVRKISRFQVSHVKEIDDSVKLPNIVHGIDIMLENVSPEQLQQQQHHQRQVAQDFVAHNIQPSPIDKSSPDKIDPMILQQQQQQLPHQENDQHYQHNQLRQLSGHIQANEMPMQSQMQQDPSTVLQTQNFTQPPQSQPQPIQPQVHQQQQIASSYPPIEPSHVINQQQQALQTTMPSIVPTSLQPVSIPVIPSMPSQVIPAQTQQQQQQQPTIVSQQQIK